MTLCKSEQNNEAERTASKQNIQRNLNLLCKYRTAEESAQESEERERERERDRERQRETEWRGRRETLNNKHN